MIPDITLETNKEQRTPCVLVVDGSYSMTSDNAIGALNAGLATFKQALEEDEEAIIRVRILIVRMGGNDEAVVLQDWVDAIDFSPPPVIADGMTPMGKAVDLAMTKIEDEKRRLDASGISYTRPWLFLLSDGLPSDQGWEEVADRCRQAQRDKEFVLFPVGVGANAQKEPLEKFGERRPMIRVDAAKFREMFVWLSVSMRAVSQSSPGEQTPLTSTESWGTFDG